MIIFDTELILQKAKMVKILFQPAFRYAAAEVFGNPRNPEYMEGYEQKTSKKELTDAVAMAPLVDIGAISESCVGIVTPDHTYYIVSWGENVVKKVAAAIEDLLDEGGEVLDLTAVSALKTGRVRNFDATDNAMIDAALDPVAAEFMLYSMSDLIVLGNMFAYTPYDPDSFGRLGDYIRKFTLISERVDKELLPPDFLRVMWRKVNDFLNEKELSEIPFPGKDGLAEAAERAVSALRDSVEK